MGPRATRAMRLCGALLALTLGACSTMQDFAGLEHAGPQPDGSYVLTAEEKATGCRLLTERANKLAASLATLPDAVTAEQNTTPNTVKGVLWRTFGSPGDGLRSADQLQQNYGQVVAINETLVEKGCPPVDIEGPLGGQRVQPTSMTH